LKKHQSHIKEFFSPAQGIQYRVDACVKENRQGNSVLVGVHLRRGDYRQWAGGKYFYNDGAFRGLMGQMSAALSDRNVRFLLVSDQPIDRTNYDGLNIAMGPGDPAGDLFSLSSCDYIIGPPSTFTLWASFYGAVPLFTIADVKAPIQLDAFTVAEG
jgi:hypothetical protein